MTGPGQLKMQIRFISLIVFSISTAASAGTWREYRSENFRYYSDRPEHKAIEDLKNLEVFRKAFFLFTGLDNSPDKTAHLAISFNNLKDYKKHGPKGSMGYYRSDANEPRMVMGPSKDSQFDRATLFHEYVHFLMDSRSNVVYPRWYFEGLAEVLSNVYIGDEKVTIGVASNNRNMALDQPGQLSVEALLKPDYSKTKSSKYWWKFYARSWLLVHYLQLGSLTNNSNHIDQTYAYLRAYESSEDPIGLFTEKFGKTPTRMDMELQAYKQQRNIYGLSFEVDNYIGKIDIRTLEKNEKLLLLAENSYLSGKEKYARKYLKKIKKGDPYSEEALSLYAVLLNHEKPFSRRAKKIIDSISDMNSLNLNTSKNIIHFYSDLILEQKKSDNLDKKLVTKAFDLCDKALEKFGSNNIVILHWKGQIHYNIGEIKETLTYALEEQKISPNNVSVLMRLGSLSLYLKRPKDALSYLEKALRHSHLQRQRANILKMRQEASEILRASKNDMVNI